MKGTVYSLHETRMGPLASEATAHKVISPGDQLQPNATILVEAGASITVEFSADCSRTYGPGTHVLEACDDDVDDDWDDNRDDDRDDDRDGNDRDGQPDTRASAVTSTTGTLVAGVVIGAVIADQIRDNGDEDPEPLSP